MKTAKLFGILSAVFSFFGIALLFLRWDQIFVFLCHSKDPLNEKFAGVLMVFFFVSMLFSVLGEGLEFWQNTFRHISWLGFLISGVIMFFYHKSLVGTTNSFTFFFDLAAITRILWWFIFSWKHLKAKIFSRA